jgi:hypothetical protein
VIFWGRFQLQGLWSSSMTLGKINFY